MIRILTDRHHHALLESLLILFEDRGILGDTEVWFPWGMDWFDGGWWNFERKHHGDAVARQYLDGIWGDVGASDGTVRVPDVRHPGRVHKGITLDAALSQRWDIVLCSLPHNDEGLHRFAQATGARFGVQVGNHVQQSRWDLADFILSSSTLPDQGLVTPDTWARPVTAHGRPCVIYHQEFSLQTFRHEWPPAERRTLASFVNCLPETVPYPSIRDFGRAHAADIDLRVYGSYGSAPVDEFAAGDISWVPDVADAMRASRIALHTKAWSDGFGHTVHNWFAIGRPVVGIARYYDDKLAGPLWVEGSTSFDVERLTEAELLALVIRLRDDDELHRRVSESAARRFREVVDFDAEAEAIRQMLGTVL